MPRNVCCVPGCPVVAEVGVPLHYFPCPERDAERFQEWVKIIGIDIASLDSTTIHKTRKICHRHFQKEFHYPKNRLCKLAVPSLLLPSADVSATSQMDSDCQPSTALEAISLNPTVIQDSTRTVENITCSSEKALRKKWMNIGEQFMNDYKKMQECLNEDNLEDSSDENCYIERSPSPQSIAGSSTSTQYSRKRKITQDISQEFMELEKKKLDLLQIKLSQSSGSQEQDCDDLLFFKSLLPYMEELSPMQKLRTRNKITQIIMDEMNSV